MRLALTPRLPAAALLSALIGVLGLGMALPEGEARAPARDLPASGSPVIDTMLALRKQTITSPLVHIAGRRETGDGGEGLFVLHPGPCRDDGIIEIADASGKCFNRVGADGKVNVRWAGARGDGIADDSSALLEAHTLFKQMVAQGVGGQLVYPAGTYNTAVTLPLPDQGMGWELRGDGFPTIVGTADNIPLLRAIVAPGKSMRNWRIGNFRLIYARPQPASNKQAVAIALGCAADSPAGLLDFQIENVVFDSAWRGISVDPVTFGEAKTLCPIWGFTIDSVTSYARMSGATIWFATNRGGSPRGNVLNFYAQNKSAIEPAISIRNMSNLYIRNAEFNLGQGTALFLNNRENLIDSIRFERMSLASEAQPLMVLRGGQYTINDLEVQSFEAVQPGRYYFLRAELASLALHNLYTWGNLSSGSTFVPVDDRTARSFTARGTWWRHNDAGVQFDAPGLKIVQPGR